MFVIKEDLLRALVRYLATKPWAEVNGLIVALDQLPQLPPPPPPPKAE